MPQGKDEYAAFGKQVKLNGEHYADACDYAAAQAIAYAMNSLFLAKLPPPPRQCPTCKCNNGGHGVNCIERTNNV